MCDMGLTLAEILSLGISLLNEKKIANADLDAWYLLEYVFHINKVQYYLNTEMRINETDYNKYMEVIKIRSNNQPLQYITGTQEFMGFEFYVNEDVLIPRQDTELLVEEVMKVANDKTVLDMCTGTSCIITSLAKLCRLEKAIGVDISEKALNLAKKNIERNQVSVELIHSDLFDNVTGRYDIIVSNPPYIPTNEIDKLMAEVKEHEPILALDGMEDGLYFYKEIVGIAKEYLNQQGTIFFEIGYNQGNQVKQILEDADFTNVQVIKDLVGLDRVVLAYNR